MGRVVDEIGKKYGKLTVKRRVANGKDNHAYYECVCDCGNVVTIRGATLRSGKAHSCGCMVSETMRKRRLGSKSERTIIVGRRFGKLVAIKRIENRHDSIMYECKCDCGNTKIARKYDLIDGSTNSCGCLRSTKESDIAALLENSGILFEREYRFDGLVGEGGKPLRYDFYLPEYNCCIEFNGGQHYKPVKYFGGETKFLKQQANDKIKTEYCNNNGIPLLVLNDTNYSDGLIFEWLENL